MKKALKILLLSIGSILAIILIVVSIAIWLVFTPERLTPIVHKQADKYIKCQSDLGEIELTFFSTFPNFGIKISNFSLINPVAGAQSDTLVSVNEITGIVDAKAWWKNNDLILIGLEMKQGTINVWADSTGKTNYDIFAADTVQVPETDEGSDNITHYIQIENDEKVPFLIDFNTFENLSQSLNFYNNQIPNINFKLKEYRNNELRSQGLL